MRRKIVAGNWKMNGDISFATEFSAELAEQFSELDCEVMIAPPAVLLSTLKSELNNVPVTLAAQNVAATAKGAFTGEVSAAMLADQGCSAVLVGHSERRSLFGESDEDVVAKVAQLLEQNLRPVLCVGETLEERDAGQENAVVGAQVSAVLDAFSVVQLSSLVLAYEPVWAIGTGRTASPQQAQDMHEHIRAVVAQKDAELASKIAILYGGSVNSKNAEDLFSQHDIDGGLVGGASLKVEDFLAICRSA